MGFEHHRQGGLPTSETLAPAGYSHSAVEGFAVSFDGLLRTYMDVFSLVGVLRTLTDACAFLELCHGCAIGTKVQCKWRRPPELVAGQARLLRHVLDNHPDRWLKQET